MVLWARRRPAQAALLGVSAAAVLALLAAILIHSAQLEKFNADLQVYAWLITHPDVRTAVETLRHALVTRGVRVDEPQLKLLDAALWTHARRHGTGAQAG